MDQDEEDFFGIQDLEISPSGVKQKAIQEESTTVELSGKDFIESQYFPDHADDQVIISSKTFMGEASTSDLQQQVQEIESGSEFIHSQYFESKLNRVGCEPVNEVKKSEIDGSAGTPFPLQEGTTRAAPSVQKQNGNISVISKPIVYDDYIADEGLEAINSRIDKVWKMSKQELLDFISHRVIYQDDDLIAFDKPYSLPYASGPKDGVQFDRLLSELRKRFSPKTGYLRVVKAIDKQVSGILLFAKNGSAYNEVIEKYKSGLIEQRYRAILSAVPSEAEAIINIPLVKVVRKGSVEMKPVISGSERMDVLHPNTEFKILSNNGSSAYVRCIVKNEFTHQIRAHFGIGLSCPILGDKKYCGSKKYWERRLPPETMHRLGLIGNQHHRLPMYLHFHEITIPRRGDGSGLCFIRALIPEFFKYTLKKLRLFVK